MEKNEFNKMLKASLEKAFRSAKDYSMSKMWKDKVIVELVDLISAIEIEKEAISLEPDLKNFQELFHENIKLESENAKLKKALDDLQNDKGFGERIEMMDIYSPEGTKVVFKFPNAGESHHQDKAAKFLKQGETYTVYKTTVGNWYTDVYLKEFPGEAFNAIMFAKIE
jgi:hypothetical protein